MNIVNELPKLVLLFKTGLIRVTCVALALFLSGCGGAEDNQSNSEGSPELNALSTSPAGLVIDASTIALVKQNNIHSTANVVSKSNEVAEVGVFNSSGVFNHPQVSTEFNGNLSASIEVSDQEGIKQVLLGFADSNLTLPLCQQDCGSQFSAFVNGISPKLFELRSGLQTLVLWVEDNDNNLSQVATLAVTWNELVISGITATVDEEQEALNVSWQPLAGMFRYNVYLSNDPSLTGPNYAELLGGEAKLALTETAARFNEKPATQTYYVLVTGVDGSGESAFSEKLAVIEGVTYEFPLTQPDEFTVNEDEVLTANLLANDNNTQTQISVQLVPVIAPNHGTLTIEQNGNIIYTPSPNFNGSDTFSYRVENAQGLTSSSSVTINVLPINDAPDANDDVFVIEGDTLTITRSQLISNDTDIDGDSLSVLDELKQQPELGQITVNSNGDFEYQKSADFTSSDSFIYLISDGIDSTQSAKVIITSTDISNIPVNSPAIVSIAPVLAVEDILYTYTPTVIDQDDENNGVDLTWSLINEPSGMQVSNLGQVTWTPKEGQLNSGIVSLIVEDSGENDSQPFVENFIVVVTPVNDPPVFDDGESVKVSVNENSPNDTVFYTSSVTDPDADDELTYNLVDGFGLFQMDAKSGALYVSNQSLLDFETTASYELAVTVSDQFSLSDSITVTVNINDVVENAEYLLDGSFGQGGITHFNTYADNQYNDYLVDAVIDNQNNRYTLTLTDNTELSKPIYTVSKIKTNGSFDLSFGNNGRKHLDVSDLKDPNVLEFDDGNLLSTFTATKLKIDDVNNHIYLLGSQSDMQTSAKPFVVRLNFSGHLDNTFSTDGKYEHSLANPADDSEAVDIIVHSDGWLYLAISSLPESGTFNHLKLDKISPEGLHSDSFVYNLLNLGGYDEHIIGLVENADNNLVALGYADNSGDTNLIAAELDISELSSILNPVEFDLGDDIEIDKIATYHAIDNSYVLLGGSTELINIYPAKSLIAKLNINTLELDSTFGDPIDGQVASGFYTGEEHQEVISLATNANNDINFIVKQVEDNCVIEYSLLLSQLNYAGSLTTLGSDLLDIPLNGDSPIIDDDKVHAVVLNDQYYNQDILNVFATIEQQNLNTQSSPAQYTSELAIYYQRIDGNNLPDEFALAEDRVDYEFQTTDSESVSAELIHSTGGIYTASTRSNLDPNLPGYTLSKHDGSNGNLNQSFFSAVNSAHLNRDSDDVKGVIPASAGMVEITQDATNGKNYIISAEVVDDQDSGDTFIRVNKIETNGLMASGFPVETSIPIGTTITDINYNAYTNKIAAFGFYGEGSESAVIITISPEDGAANSITFSEVESYMIEGSRLTSGVVQYDGSIIAVGTGSTGQTTNTFLIKVNNDGTLDSTLNNSAALQESEHILVIDNKGSSGVESGKLVQLSDSSIIYIVNDSDLNEATLVKVINVAADPSEQKYVLDSNFDAYTDNTNDGMIPIDLSALGSQPQLVATAMNDMIKTDNDHIIFIGHADFGASDASFIGQFNGRYGTPHSTLGKNTLPGYFIPYGRQDCNSAASSLDVDLCDITNYEKLSLYNNALIIHATVASTPENASNTAILKFVLTQKDLAQSYQMPSAGGG